LGFAEPVCRPSDLYRAIGPGYAGQWLAGCRKNIYEREIQCQLIGRRLRGLRGQARFVTAVAKLLNRQRGPLKVIFREERGRIAMNDLEIRPLAWCIKRPLAHDQVVAQ
jgi:hypothetical protein